MIRPIPLLGTRQLMSIPTCNTVKSTRNAGPTVLLCLGLLLSPITVVQSIASPTTQSAAAPAIDPAAQALYLKTTSADSRLSYRGRLNTTYWRTGRVTSVIVRHMAPSSLRIDYVEPDSVRGRAVVVIADTEWTYNPSRLSLTHRPYVPHSSESSASLKLLQRNYILKVLPQTDTYIHRTTSILEVLRRSNRTMARKLWIDNDTGLALKREVLSEDGKLTVTIAYSDITFHPQLTAANFDLSYVAKVKGWQQVDETKTAKVSVPAAQAMPLAGVTYPLEAAGYKLVGSSIRQINERQTEELHYSDGLELLSLFEQTRGRANKPTRVPSGMAPVTINRKTAHFIRRSSLETLIWDSGPLRLTLVGEANHDRMLAFATAVDQFVSNSKPK